MGRAVQLGLAASAFLGVSMQRHLPAAQEDKLGLRWRTEAEVLSGKGQFSCGARGCSETRGLATFEVPFGYSEAGQRKDALVKVSTLWAQLRQQGTLEMPSLLDYRLSYPDTE